MRQAIATTLRNLVSPSLRFELKNHAAYLAELRSRACLWRWEVARLPRRDGGMHDIVYLGRKATRRQAMALLGIGDAAAGARSGGGTGTILASEMPVPGALRVPKLLTVIVPLGRTMDEVIAGYDANLRRLVRRQRPNYSTRQVVDDAGIALLERDMLRPFAARRHGDDAVQMTLGHVRAMARSDWGRLDAIYAGDEAVGCQLGYEFSRGGRRYWGLYRFGCPEAVLAHDRQLAETNAMHIHLETEWATEHGFDFLELGPAPARPDGGALQWKKRRRGDLDTLGNNDYLYVRLPRRGAARFLWDAPLFSVKRGRLALHLGIPDGPGDEEIFLRYREMGFRGLSKVYLHCERALGEELLDKFRALYAGESAPPSVVPVRVSRLISACAVPDMAPEQGC